MRSAAPAMCSLPSPWSMEVGHPSRDFRGNFKEAREATRSFSMALFAFFCLVFQSCMFLKVLNGFFSMVFAARPLSKTVDSRLHRLGDAES